jgi:peptide/nickel transport system permease protein
MNPQARRLLGRLGNSLLVLVVATFAVSMLMRLLPVDLAQVLLPTGSEAERSALRAEIGLDKNPFAYYVSWLWDFVRGDFGNIYFSGGVESVGSRLASAVPRSLLLMLYAQIIALAAAIPLGMWSGYRAGRRADRVISTTLFSFSAIPSFAIGLTLIVVIGVRFQWLPTLGYEPLSAGLWVHFSHMIMPALSLSLGLIATYTRLLRADVVATLREDYVTMAASKGISNSRILWQHVFRPSSLTLFTSAALNMGALIGGAIVVEAVFATYGLGFEVYTALQGRQFIALQSYVAVIAIFYVLFNLIVDEAAGFVDPRTRNRKLNG